MGLRRCRCLLTQSPSVPGMDSKVGTALAGYEGQAGIIAGKLIEVRGRHHPAGSFLSVSGAAVTGGSAVYLNRCQST